MKWNAIATICVVLLGVVSGAMACAYHCASTDYPVEGTTPDITAVPGQAITFTGSVTSGVTYSWTVWDDSGGQQGSSASGNTFHWTVPDLTGKNGLGDYLSDYWTVQYTVTSTDTLGCIQRGCIKIKDTATLTCPQYPNFCCGSTPSPVPSVTIPAHLTTTGWTYEWHIDSTTINDGNPLTWSGWSGLSAGIHTAYVKILAPNNDVVQRCPASGTVSFNVQAVPNSVITWS